MKLLLAFLSILFCQLVTGQELKSYKAVRAADSAYFQPADFDEKGEPIGDLEFLKGCSWYCGPGMKQIVASSSLNSTNAITYVAKNAHDFDKNTAWVEGATDQGLGEYLEYTFNYADLAGYEGNLGIHTILLANGYKKNRTIWQNNSRVKQFKVYLNDEPYAIVDLLDLFEIQTVAIDTIMFPANKTTKLRFEITAVYPGAKYKDTAISLLMFDGVGVH